MTTCLQQIIATTAIVAATTLAYYWGYQDVEKRHSPERERGFQHIPPSLSVRDYHRNALIEYVALQVRLPLLTQVLRSGVEAIYCERGYVDQHEQNRLITSDDEKLCRCIQYFFYLYNIHSGIHLINSSKRCK